MFSCTTILFWLRENQILVQQNRIDAQQKSFAVRENQFRAQQRPFEPVKTPLLCKKTGLLYMKSVSAKLGSREISHAHEPGPGRAARHGGLAPQRVTNEESRGGRGSEGPDPSQPAGRRAPAPGHAPLAGPRPPNPEEKVRPPLRVAELRRKPIAPALREGLAGPRERSGG